MQPLPRDQLTWDELMVKPKPLPPIEVVKELLSYDPEAGEFHWIKAASPYVAVGSLAGCIELNGYRSIKIQGRHCKAHRLAWLLGHGEDPGELYVDHINRDKLDNRLCNLRLADCSQNRGNSGKTKLNSTGYKGVTRSKRDGKWGASIMARGVNHYLGHFSTAEEAHAAYAAAAKKLHGEFARVF